MTKKLGYYKIIAHSGNRVDNKMTKEKKKKQYSSKGKVLLMDDDEVTRSAIGNLLENLGYKVEACGEGWEVLNRYEKSLKEKTPFDAVVLDLKVTDGLGGKKTMKRLLDIDPKAKGIVSSGFSGESILSDYQKFGFAGVVEKPYKIEKLDEALVKIMSNKLT